MTVNRLHRILTALIGSGQGRKPVAIDKSTFRHNCESDGVVILDVEEAELMWVPLSDDDGGTAVTAKGLERGSTRLVLYGAARRIGEAIRKAQLRAQFPTGAAK